MKFENVDNIPQRNKKSKYVDAIEEFIKSGEKIVKVNEKNLSNTSVMYGFKYAIKKHKYNNVRVILRRGETYLMRVIQ
jgi:hypothetical protein